MLSLPARDLLLALCLEPCCTEETSQLVGKAYVGFMVLMCAMPGAVSTVGLWLEPSEPSSINELCCCGRDMLVLVCGCAQRSFECAAAAVIMLKQKN